MVILLSWVIDPKLLEPHFKGLTKIQRDSKRWTQFHTSIFPEPNMVCE